MRDVAEFLAHAIKLEEDAANRFSDLEQAMKSYGNNESANFFGKLAHFSRLHLAQAKRRAGYHDLPELKEEDYIWPSGESPEATSMEASHYLMNVEYSVQLALDGERSSYEFYQNIANTTPDPEIRVMAIEFATEEAEHVLELEKWIARAKEATAS